MGRPRRQIISGNVYEICFRTKMGLPFVPTFYMKMLIESVVARVQRDLKVIICHDIWMTNHLHMIIVALDSMQCKAFYGEVKKQLTDALKRLLDLDELSLWKANGTSVSRYRDIESIEHRIAYLYANPARANMVETIEDYPGVSSWKAFKKVEDRVDAEHTKDCPWVRQPAIEKLPSKAVTLAQDREITRRLRKSTKEVHELTRQPNAWMAAFDITEKDEIAKENRVILDKIKEFEREAAEKRKAEKKVVMGRRKLCAKPVDLSYRSKSKDLKIYVYSVFEETRIAMLQAYRRFCELCDECYRQWKLGNHKVIWPPGAYMPAMPPTANYLED
jgi:REP element-mobilizing transposase RayT